MFSKTIKVIVVSSSIFFMTGAHADNWNAYIPYPQGGYAPIVQEEIIVSPRGGVEEIIVVPERSVQYQQFQPVYPAPAPTYYSYQQPERFYRHRDWDDR